VMSNSRLWWPTREQVLRRHGLMDQMMEKRCVDAYAARRVDGGLAFTEARAKCSYCLQEEDCRRWLTIGTPRTSPEFCLNGAFFLNCRGAD
jgi:Family of unknown function (DUF6455)